MVFLYLEIRELVMFPYPSIMLLTAINKECLEHSELLNL